MSTNILSLPHLLDYEATLEPLWGDDAGRENMEGTFSGTFKGYFTNLTLSFGSCTQSELYIIKSVLQKPVTNLIYPDSDVLDDKTYTEEFYGTAIKAKRNKVNGKYKPFSVKLVGTHKKANANMEG